MSASQLPERRHDRQHLADVGGGQRLVLQQRGRQAVQVRLLVPLQSRSNLSMTSMSLRAVRSYIVTGAY